MYRNTYCPLPTIYDLQDDVILLRDALLPIINDTHVLLYNLSIYIKNQHISNEQVFGGMLKLTRDKIRFIINGTKTEYMLRKYPHVNSRRLLFLDTYIERHATKKFMNNIIQLWDFANFLFSNNITFL